MGLGDPLCWDNDFHESYEEIARREKRRILDLFNNEEVKCLDINDKKTENFINIIKSILTEELVIIKAEELKHCKTVKKAEEQLKDILLNGFIGLENKNIESLVEMYNEVKNKKDMDEIIDIALSASKILTYWNRKHYEFYNGREEYAELRKIKNISSNMVHACDTNKTTLCGKEIYGDNKARYSKISNLKNINEITCKTCLQLLNRKE